MSGFHSVDAAGDDLRLRPVRPAPERQDEGRGQLGRRLPHRLKVQEERREDGESTFFWGETQSVQVIVAQDDHLVIAPSLQLFV